MVFGARDLKYGILGPSGSSCAPSKAFGNSLAEPHEDGRAELRKCVEFFPRGSIVSPIEALE